MLPSIPGMNNQAMGGMNPANMDELSLMMSMQNAGLNPAAMGMFGQQNNPQLPLLDFSAHKKTAQ